MSEEMRAIIREEIHSSIKTIVNGKIDALDKKIDTHNATHEAVMKELKPYLQAASGLGLLFKFFIMVGSASVAYMAIKNGILNMFTIEKI